MGEVIIHAVDEKREADLDYCRDFFGDFVELAESYAPGIVEEFVKKFPWQHRKWLKDGCVVRMGGG